MKAFKYLMMSMLALCACSNFDDLNTDPDNPTKMDPDLLISTIEYYPGAEWQEQNRYFIYPAGFMNQWTGAWSTVEYAGCGQKHTNYHERLWATYFPEGIKNSVDVIRRTANDPEKVNIYNMARVLHVQLAQRLTDYYGDIPYSEAALGYYDHNLKPAYDKQEDIYKDFLKELKEAAEGFDASKPRSQYDLIYGGDVEKWRKYANTLRLRVAMRLVKADPTLAQQEAEDAIRSGLFTSNSDNAMVVFENLRNGSSGKGKGNGVSNYLYGNNDANGSEIWLTCELVKTLEDTNDPRLLIYGAVMLNDNARTDVTALVKAKRSCYAAMAVPAQRYSYSQNPDYPSDNSALSLTVGGKTVDLALRDTRLRPSKYLTAFNAPYIYISYAEAELLTAEAAARGWDVKGTAAEHYQAGVRGAIEQWRLFGAEPSATQINTYLVANPYDATDGIRQINTQLWIHHILDPLETWANYRRSGYPLLVFHNYEPSKNQSNGTFPRRMMYPLEEQLKNPINYQDAISRMGGVDDWTTPVWWDKD